MVVVWLHWTVDESFFFNTANDGLDCDPNVYLPAAESSFLAANIGVGATKEK